MYKQTKPSQEDKSEAVAHSVSQKKDVPKKQLSFVDNRLETIAQRKLFQQANTSSEVVQRITEEEHQKLYSDAQRPLGLRFQPGSELPTKKIQGDQYSLQDHRFRAQTDIDKRFPQLARPSVSAAEYTTMLNQTVSSAVGFVKGLYFDARSDKTLKQTFDAIRNYGQLTIINSSRVGLRADYDGAFSSVGKGEINPEDFKIRIPIINPLDYDHFKLKLNETWNPKWATEIWPYILKEVQERVHNAVKLQLGGKLGAYTIPPDFDDDPDEFLQLLDSI